MVAPPAGRVLPLSRPPSPPPPQDPKKPKKPRHFESSREEAPSPPPEPCPKPKVKAKPRPPNPRPPLLASRSRDPYGNVPGVGHTRYVPWREGGDGGDR